MVDCVLFTLLGPAPNQPYLVLTLTGHINVLVPNFGLVTFPVLLSRPVLPVVQPSPHPTPTSSPQ